MSRSQCSLSVNQRRTVPTPRKRESRNDIHNVLHSPLQSRAEAFGRRSLSAGHFPLPLARDDSKYTGKPREKLTNDIELLRTTMEDLGYGVKILPGLSHLTNTPSDDCYEAKEKIDLLGW